MEGRGTIVLDARLSTVAALVGRCELYADIGCDHGRLGAYLLSGGYVRRAMLTDISADSLQKARRLIGGLGLSDRVEFLVGDGARALTATPEVAVVAGMGGVLIARILREGRAQLGASRLVLQPNVADVELRRALVALGYSIVDERIAPDGRRNYPIIMAEPGQASYGERELVVGPVLLKTLPPTLAPYAAFQLRVAKKALAGARAGKDAPQAEVLERRIAIWEEVWACLQR